MDVKIVVSSVLGFAVGALATYFVMDYMQEKELDIIYSDFEAEKSEVKKVSGEKHEKTIAVKFKHPVEEYDFSDSVIICPEGAEDVDELSDDLLTDEELDERYSEDLEADVDKSEEELAFDYEQLLESEGYFDDPDAEEPIIDNWEAIILIQPDQVSGRQVVAAYNLEDDDITISKMLSVESEKFDDVVESEALEPLLGTEAVNILRTGDSEAEAKMLCIRNNILNLDFVITY